MAVPTERAWAEHIAFLDILHDGPPVRPSKNELGNLPIRHQDYVLPFRRERHFVGACAFLSNIETNIYSIPAVCVRESRGTESLELLIAVNKRTADDGREYLQDIKSGFRRIFEELRQTDIDNGREVQSRVFDAVVSMCCQRILERLGVDSIRKASGKVHKPVQGDLATAVNYLREAQGPRELVDVTQDAVQKLRKIIRAIDAWLNHRVLPDLRVVLDAVYDLFNARGWKQVLDSIPNRIMSPSHRNKIANFVAKIARYREVARYLCRTAKKFPIARDIRVVVVDLPSRAFEETPLSGYIPKLDEFFRSIQPRKTTLARLCRQLSISEGDAQLSFQRGIRDILGVSRIHAEVQLLVYCDLSITGPKPRVICSSKEACFLCNQLIKAHGKVYTPSCHGKMYTPWRLPNIGDGEPSRRLQSILEEFTRDSLRTMRLRNSRIKHPLPPNESATHSLVVSSTTLAGPESAVVEELQGGVGTIAPGAVGASSPALEQYNASAAIKIPRVCGTMPADQEHSTTSLRFPSGARLDVYPVVSGGRISDRSNFEEQRHLENVEVKVADGEAPAHQTLADSSVPTDKVENPAHALHQTATWKKSVLVGRGTHVSTHAFDLVVETAPGASQRAKSLVCNLALLEAEYATAVLERRNPLVVNVDDLEQERSFPLAQCLQLPFYVSAAGCILEVSLRDEERITKGN